MPYRTNARPQVLDVYVFRLEVTRPDGWDADALQSHLNAVLDQQAPGAARCELVQNLRSPSPQRPDAEALAALVNMPKGAIEMALAKGNGYLDIARHMTDTCQDPEHYNTIIATLVRELAARL